MRKKHLRIVVSNVSVAPKEKKVYWWRRMHPLRALQVPVGVVIVVSIVLASFFAANDIWHSASTMWMLAFIFMYLFWALEYKMQKDFDLYKTED